MLQGVFLLILCPQTPKHQIAHIGSFFRETEMQLMRKEVPLFKFCWCKTEINS